MKKIATIFVLIALLASVTTTFAFEPAASDVQTEEISYIAIMEAAPIIAYEGDEAGMAPTKPGKGGKINPNSAHVKKYQEFLEKSHDKALSDAGVSANKKINEYTYALNGFSAIMTVDQARELERQPGVVKVMKDEMRYPDTDSAPDFLGLTEPGGLWAKGYDGEGVVVGIIDTGIWPEHPSFADDGSYSHPPIMDLEDTPENPSCEFGNDAHNELDVSFECNNKLIGARQMLATYRYYEGAEDYEYDSARDDGGHGTHTASTAAGNAGVEASTLGIPRGTISGIAPRAHVIAYKGLGYGGGYSSDLAEAIDQAVADGVDVINYSIGGGASLFGADEIAFMWAASAGVNVATSAGNAGPGPGTVGGPGTVPWITTVGANTQSRFFQGTVVLGDGSEYTGASITEGTDEQKSLVDAVDFSNELCQSSIPFVGDISDKIVLCKRGAVARADKSLAVDMAGGAGMIMYNTDDVGNLASDSHWVPSVHIDLADGEAIKAYIAGDADPKATIYAEQLSEWPYAPSMTKFSSRGPDTVAMDLIKPDITAPGTQILAGYSPTPNEPYDQQGELFMAIQGTSMSSPIVAGAFALLKQAHPDWSAAMAKSAIMTTAYQEDVVDNDRVSPADPFAIGAGHLNIGGKANKGSAFEPGLAYDAGLLDYAGFICGIRDDFWVPGTCEWLESIDVPFDASDLNLPSIGIAELPGSQTVVRTVTSVAKEKGWRTYNVSVDAPAGYDVTVEPSTFSLKSGQSATYEVTITNVSAPSGEWHFGSLTWNDDTGHYDVYSPIAVRTTAVSAPYQVIGSGVEGSASFDVTFGYNGDYTAEAHGLEPATVTSDNVLQDPDQDFDPTDGWSNLHQFALSGAAHFRIAMPEDATEADADLDIFVYKDGVQVASSTSGGTHELIDISDPDDGVWDVYVHGWKCPGGDSDYDMYTWVISATPGGNLVIDDAPTSATAGAVETIDVSWTGATAGLWHLGAVSHNDAMGLIGLTLVDVDNR